MKIAVSVWDGNVSPVLDTAERFIVFDIEDGNIISRSELPIEDRRLQVKAKKIADNARILICGALSNHMASFLSSFGLEVYPWVMGNAEQLVEMFASGNIPGPEFSMPGCRGRRCGPGVGRKRHGRSWDSNLRNY